MSGEHWRTHHWTGTGMCGCALVTSKGGAGLQWQEEGPCGPGGPHRQSRAGEAREGRSSSRQGRAELTQFRGTEGPWAEVCSAQRGVESLGRGEGGMGVTCV